MASGSKGGRRRGGSISVLDGSLAYVTSGAPRRETSVSIGAPYCHPTRSSTSRDTGHILSVLSLDHVTNWNSRSSKALSFPPRIRHTKSLTTFSWPAKRSTGAGSSIPNISSAFSPRWGSESTPRPKGRLRARQTG